MCVSQIANLSFPIKRQEIGSASWSFSVGRQAGNRAVNIISQPPSHLCKPPWACRAQTTKSLECKTQIADNEWVHLRVHHAIPFLCALSRIASPQRRALNVALLVLRVWYDRYRHRYYFTHSIDTVQSSQPPAAEVAKLLIRTRHCTKLQECTARRRR